MKKKIWVTAKVARVVIVAALVATIVGGPWDQGNIKIALGEKIQISPAAISKAQKTKGE
ncbi:hypothetical protein ACFLVI_02645 [Chloroflexota bacterium]